MNRTLSTGLDIPKFDSVEQAVEYLVSCWTLVTGEPGHAMHEEGHFPDEVDEFIDAAGFDYEYFQNAWDSYWS